MILGALTLFLCFLGPLLLDPCMRYPALALIPLIAALYVYCRSWEFRFQYNSGILILGLWFPAFLALAKVLVPMQWPLLFPVEGPIEDIYGLAYHPVYFVLIADAWLLAAFTAGVVEWLVGVVYNRRHPRAEIDLGLVRFALGLLGTALLVRISLGLVPQATLDSLGAIHPALPGIGMVPVILVGLFGLLILWEMEPELKPERELVAMEVEVPDTITDPKERREYQLKVADSILKQRQKEWEARQAAEQWAKDCQRYWNGQAPGEDAGIRFEQYVTRHLQYLTRQGYWIISNVLIRGIGESQIDHLAIGDNGIFVIEAKFRNGAYRILPNGQWLFVRRGARTVEPQESPADQNYRHILDLHEFLKKRLPDVADSINLHNVVCVWENTPIEGTSNCTNAVICTPAGLLQTIPAASGQNPLTYEQRRELVNLLREESQRNRAEYQVRHQQVNTDSVVH